MTMKRQLLISTFFILLSLCLFVISIYIALSAMNHSFNSSVNIYYEAPINVALNLVNNEGSNITEDNVSIVLNPEDITEFRIDGVVPEIVDGTTTNLDDITNSNNQEFYYFSTVPQDSSGNVITGSSGIETASSVMSSENLQTVSDELTYTDKENANIFAQRYYVSTAQNPVWYEMPSEMTQLYSTFLTPNLTDFADGQSISGDVVISHSLNGSITDRAFYQNRTITSVVIPNTITSIGEWAFYQSYILSNIVLPSSLTSIGSNAFYYCCGLSNMVIPNNVTSIGSSAFRYCYKLVEVYNLSSLNIRLNNSSYGYAGYYADYVYNTSTPSEKQFIVDNEYVMYNNKNSYYLLGYIGNETELILPTTTYNYEIYECAFYDCSNLTGNLVIPEGVTSIGDYAFWECSSLNGTLSLPSTLTSIGSSAFYNCSSLNSVYIEDIVAWCKIEFYNSYSNPLYSAKKLYLNNELVTDLVIPEGVTSISNYAFGNCSSLNGKLSLPSTLTSIGDDAFYNCSSLTGDLVIPEGVTSIGQSAFFNCSSLTGDLVIPEGVTSIGTYTFYDCSSLNGTLTLPSTLTSIGESAFRSCSNLTGNLVIPEGVTSIGSSAFDGCRSLNGTLSLPSTLTSIGYSAFEDCSNLTGSLVIPEGITSISNYAFSNCSSLTGNLVIPEGVTSIGNSAFSGCRSLNGTLSLPSTLTSIGAAFAGCSSLTGNLVIPEGVTSIGNSAFYNCSSLTGNLVIPEGVTSIGYRAFSYCSSLNGTLSLPSTLTSIGNEAFRSCSSLTGSLVIPEGVTSIGSNAFYSCIRLRIYCEVASQPSGWNSAWNPTNCPVYWANEWHYENGVPVANSVNLSFVNNEGSQINDTTTQLVFNEDYTQFRIDGIVPETSTGVTSNLTDLTSTSGQEFYFFSSVSDWDVTTDDFDRYYVSTEEEPIWYDVPSEQITLYSIFLTPNCTDGTQNTIGDNTDIVISHQVTSIPEEAFMGNDIITSVVLPNSIEVIESKAFMGSVSIATRAPEPPVTGPSTSVLSRVILSSSIKSLEIYAFTNCDKIQTIRIPKATTSIGMYAFSACTKLENVIFEKGSNLENIGDSAFTDCSALISIEIPDGVTGISQATFSGCSGLTDISIPNSIRNISRTAFYGCDNLNFTVYNNAKYLGNSSNQYLCLYEPTQETVTTCVVHSQCKLIIEDAFEDCANLISVDIPNSVMYIGNSAFMNCSSLSSVIFSNNLINIGASAFRNCSTLTSINIPGSVTSIGSAAFRDCASIKSLTFEENSQLRSLGMYAFFNCSSLVSVILPKSLIHISNYVFEDCINLESIVIPISVDNLALDFIGNNPKLIVYCEAESQPDGWASSWNPDNRPVYWAGEWGYDEGGNPVVIE